MPAGPVGPAARHGALPRRDDRRRADAPRAGAGAAGRRPWWDPGSDASVDPEHDAVRIGDVEVGRGSRVILRPGVRRADAYDLFLAGRDGDGRRRAARRRPRRATWPSPSTTTRAPTSRTAHGRYLYFAPDEVEPLGAGGRAVDDAASWSPASATSSSPTTAFGVEVARRTGRRDLPDGCEVVDFGIRSVHLVYELLDGYDVLVLVDTVAQQDGPPGSLYVIEPGPGRDRRPGDAAARGDARRPRPVRRAG